MRVRFSLLIALTALMFSGLALAAQTGKGTEAAPEKNPVKADAISVGAGKKLYQSNCTPCHGDTGKGDGKMASQFNPPPPDLTDAEWKHGSTDPEIFVVIRDGVKSTGMKGFASKMTTHQIWDVVNYLRSIGPTAANSR